MRRYLATAAFILAALMAAAPMAFAQLERMGPISTSNGYPTWFQDKTGLAVEFCSPLNTSELAGGWCLLLPGDTTAPEVFPSPFFDEHFYWDADAAFNFANGDKARLKLAIEGAFVNGAVVPGDQMTFGRLRIQIPTLPVSGDYVVETPYGTYNFAGQVAGDKIFFTIDIGVACPGTFTCTLGTNVAPFLLPSAVSGGPEMAPLTAANPTPDTNPAHFGGAFVPTPYPGTGKAYIADPARIGPVTGSPVINAVNGLPQNWFRVYANGVLLGGTSDFSLMGRVFNGSVPGKVSVDRAALTMIGSQKLDVFASAFPTMQTRLPAGAVPATVTPVLSFFDVACGRAADGSLIAPVGAAKTQMFGAGKYYWGQKPGSFAQVNVCVVDDSARTVTGAIVPTFTEHIVTDDIAISAATWNPSTGALTVSATSSCGVALNATGFAPLVAGTMTATVTAPPSEIEVTSVLSGSARLLVTTGVFAGPGPGTGPVAVNDAVTINEDTTVDIDVLANDAPGGTPVTINLGVPRLGTASLLLGKVHYVPNPNVNGSDSIAYSITVNGVTSPTAFVAITINPVNDPPTAVNDNMQAVRAVSTPLNLLANDTDPDGAADLNTVVIVTPPVGATAVVGAGGVVTFTAANSGTFTFTYRAVDKANVQSGNAATVTVVVANAETIAFVRSDFIGNKLRWRIDGTDTVLAGQTITVTYNNGTRANGTSLVGTVIGTATVDVTGAWTVDLVVGSNDIRNLSNPALFGTRPSQVKATSSLSGAASQTNPIALR
jgi:hypothetical protein